MRLRLRLTLKTLLVVAVLLCGAGSAWGVDLTFDGYDWLPWGSVTRDGYVLGVQKATMDPVAKDPVVARWNIAVNPFATPGHTVGDVSKAVTSFYASPKNRSILIIIAIKIVALKFRGVSAPCIKEYTVFERQVAAGASKAMQIPQIALVSKACTGQAYAPNPIPRARYGFAESNQRTAVSRSQGAASAP